MGAAGFEMQLVPCRMGEHMNKRCFSLLSHPVAAKIAVAPSSEVQEGQGVNLTCYLSSSSANTANYSWYRNGQQVTEGPASALVFQQVKSTDAGIYYCKAVMNQTSKSSSTVSLNVLCKSWLCLGLHLCMDLAPCYMHGCSYVWARHVRHVCRAHVFLCMQGNICL